MIRIFWGINFFDYIMGGATIHSISAVEIRQHGQNHHWFHRMAYLSSHIVGKKNIYIKPFGLRIFICINKDIQKKSFFGMSTSWDGYRSMHRAWKLVGLALQRHTLYGVYPQSPNFLVVCLNSYHKVWALRTCRQVGRQNRNDYRIQKKK